MTGGKNPQIIVTAGGTREKIDDVRYLGNFSSGRLGCALAQSAARLGYNVLLLAPASTVERFGSPPDVDYRPFTSAESLKRKILSLDSATFIFHSAAVADYAPARVEGKISSDPNELTLKLYRTPKILQMLRPHFGDRTVIAGFKLLSNVTEEQLIDVARRQLRSSGTDFCVANDLREIGDGVRRVHIVDSSEKYSTLKGSTPEVADAIASQILSRGVRDF